MRLERFVIENDTDALVALFAALKHGRQPEEQEDDNGETA